MRNFLRVSRLPADRKVSAIHRGNTIYHVRRPVAIFPDGTKKGAALAGYTARTLSMTAGIIGLAGVAAYFGLAHSCDPQGGSGGIAGQVLIAPHLASQVKPTDVLFVIVRRPTGPPRPLAAKRIDGPVFPVSFEITSADVMMQGTELRGMVDVIARLDRDGQAGQPQPGDMEGRYEKNPTLPGGRDITITIDKVY
jgi:cytochrome c-type biogenesis protein CcmH